MDNMDLRHFTSDRDITKEWTKAARTRGVALERREYTVGGTTYTVDGRHVVLCPTKQETHIAEILAEKYGKQIELVPQVMYPQGIQTPDYLIDGERFDLKTLSGQGKNLLYGAIAKKRRQAHNFIIDITPCPLPMEEIEKQIVGLSHSPRTGFVKKLVLMQGEEVVRVYARKQKETVHRANQPIPKNRDRGLENDLPGSFIPYMQGKSKRFCLFEQLSRTSGSGTITGGHPGACCWPKAAASDKTAPCLRAGKKTVRPPRIFNAGPHLVIL